MNLNRKEIIVNGTIGNQQKQIILSKEPFTTAIYNIMIDKEYHGQVIKNISGWMYIPMKKVGSKIKIVM